MWAERFVAEVRRLAEPGLSRSASQALGYREVLRHLAGGLSLEEAKEVTRRRTRQLAKRQLTWFRSLPDIHWVDVAPDQSAADVAAQVLGVLKRRATA